MGRVDLVPFSSSLLTRLGELGVDVPAVLDRAGVERPTTRSIGVTTAQFFAIWHLVAASNPPRDLGLQIGAASLPNRANIASVAALHAPTFGQALERFARYKRLSCPEEVAIEVKAGEARVRFEWLLAQEDPPSFLIDGMLSGVLTLARLGTGTNIVPRHIALTRRKRDVVMLRNWFGCEIIFDAAADLIAFDEKALAMPFVTHDPAWSAAILPELTAQLGEPRSVDEAVRATLGRKLGERPSVDGIARALGMSSRTLQRRLGEVGTSYQAVLDDVRRRSARRLLAATDLDTPAVAFLLGFEELNSFTRAFHNWEGTTPLRWRNSQ